MFILIRTAIIFILFIITTAALAGDIKDKISSEFYSKINNFSQNFGSGLAESLNSFENLEYLDISLNIQEGLKPTLEIQSVTRIHEYSDGAFFNQLNLLSQDKKNTINLGFGNRKFYSNDELMLGANTFLDYQSEQSHLRYGLGFEAISNSIDFIANYYNAISGFKTTIDGSEKALDGYDFKLNYHLSDVTKTDLFFEIFEWKNPNSSFKEKGEKFGLSSMIGNFSLQAGYLNSDKNNDGFFGSLKLIIPLGETKELLVKNKNNKKIENKSVRDKLYMPVQRENKIKLVKLSSGVKVSGF